MAKKIVLHKRSTSSSPNGRRRTRSIPRFTLAIVSE